MKTLIGMPNDLEHPIEWLPKKTADDTGVRKRKRVFLGTPVHIPPTVSRRKLDHCRVNLRPELRQHHALATVIVCAIVAAGFTLAGWL